MPPKELSSGDITAALIKAVFSSKKRKDDDAKEKKEKKQKQQPAAAAAADIYVCVMCGASAIPQAHGGCPHCKGVKSLAARMRAMKKLRMAEEKAKKEEAEVKEKAERAARLRGLGIQTTFPPEAIKQVFACIAQQRLAVIRDVIYLEKITGDAVALLEEEKKTIEKDGKEEEEEDDYYSKIEENIGGLDAQRNEHDEYLENLQLHQKQGREPTADS